MHDEKRFSSLEEFGKHFGIEPSNQKKQNSSLTAMPFLGREDELSCLRKFIEDDNFNIFGLYGVPMIGKSFLIRYFLENDSILKSYTRLLQF